MAGRACGSRLGRGEPGAQSVSSRKHSTRCWFHRRAQGDHPAAGLALRAPVRPGHTRFHRGGRWGDGRGRPHAGRRRSVGELRGGGGARRGGAASARRAAVAVGRRAVAAALPWQMGGPAARTDFRDRTRPLHIRVPRAGARRDF